VRKRLKLKLYNLHTCKVQISAHLEKAKSFNADLSNYYWRMHDACLPSLEKWIMPSSSVTIPLHSCF